MLLYEGVADLLTSMLLLALLGVRHPIRLLPIRLFETLWKGDLACCRSAACGGRR